MGTYSSASGKAFTLHPRRSLALRSWWIALHAVFVMTLLALSLPLLYWLASLGLVAGHLVARFPRASTETLAFSHGAWALPGQGRYGLKLGRRTQLSISWVRLDFGPHGPQFLLWKDQLRLDDWRRLQLAVRSALARAD